MLRSDVVTQSPAISRPSRGKRNNQSRGDSFLKTRGHLSADVVNHTTYSLEKLTPHSLGTNITRLNVWQPYGKLKAKLGVRP